MNKDTYDEINNQLCYKYGLNFNQMNNLRDRIIPTALQCMTMCCAMVDPGFLVGRGAAIPRQKSRA